MTGTLHEGQSQWQRGLRRRSTAARLLRLWVRIQSALNRSAERLCGTQLKRSRHKMRDRQNTLVCVCVCDLRSP